MWAKIGIVLGLIFLIVSLFPWEPWVTQQMWSPEDSEQYDRVTFRYHESAYQTPAREGLSQAEWESRHKRLQEKYESLRSKLESSQTQPHRWKQILRWTGLLLLLGGALGYTSGNTKKKGP